MSILLTIFVLVFLTELVRWIGKSVLLELLYPVYTRIFLKSTVDRQRTLRADVLAAKRDLLQTSSQDQFAKWAKLRRRVDRGLAELDTINSTLASARTSFSVKFSTVLWTDSPDTCLTIIGFLIHDVAFAWHWLLLNINSFRMAQDGGTAAQQYSIFLQAGWAQQPAAVFGRWPVSVFLELLNDSYEMHLSNTKILPSLSKITTRHPPHPRPRHAPKKPSPSFDDTPGNNTSADEKSTGTASARDRDRAELRARLAARQSARAAK
ncbi:hypothetical protein RhiXN_10360 [Rhizoctonia solani]|uniref:Guided entry of tail-anchored proteins 1 n=1 Tax=Rhizoctonia solani TaxID=456999 RepID=A0A8H8P512_9AGAM|nr:uncharacterized protein RhiXN_10360 [Rhizoctonia solani]QRW24036.1 hypothetical protein RhiXN_10360 [Rhizoctonia solani]